MTHELINPDGLPRPLSYTHVVVASGTRIVFIGGQVAEDPDDNLVGRGDVAAQARQASPTSAAASPRPRPSRIR